MSWLAWLRLENFNAASAKWRRLQEEAKAKEEEALEWSGRPTWNRIARQSISFKLPLPREREREGLKLSKVLAE